MLAWVALTVSIILTLLVSYAERSDVEQASEARLAFAAEQISLRIEERLNAYALLLRGGAGLFVASDEVTREDWKSYVDNLQLENNLTGVQGIGFSRLIRPADLAEHINTVRSEGFNDYTVTPAGEREVYSAILYLEPFSGRNLRAFGYDMFSDPVRRAAMSRARDLNEASLSGKVELVQEVDTDVQAGTLLYVPVYRHDMPSATVAQRNEALIGWVYSPFRMSDLMAGLISDWTQVDMTAIGIRIYDSPEKSPDNLMFTSSGLTDHAADGQRLLSRVLSIHGQQWLLEFEQSALRQNQDYGVAWRALISGLLLSLLLFLLLTSMARTRNRALKIARELTHDIQQSESRLRLAHQKAEQFREALDYVNSYIFIKDKNRRYVYANKSTLELFRCTAEELTGASDEQFFPAASCAQIKEADTHVLAGHKNRSEVTVHHSDGTRTIYLDVKTPVYDGSDQNTVTGILGISTDITSIKDYEEKLERIAHYDALTSLPNRLLLGDRLHRAIVHSNRSHRKLAVVYLDLDGFKAVNDTHGHDVGDELLRVVATRLKDTLRDGDTVARIGGDEFVAVLVDVDDPGHVQAVVQRMMDAAADPVYVRGLDLRVSASIGVSLYPQAGTGEQPGADKLLRQADQAMYQSKSAGKNRAFLFTESGTMIALVTDKQP